MATSAEREELASLAGFTVAFFNSNSELKSLFNRAMRENWTGDRLLQASRNTKWFKSTSAAAREAQLLATSDPAEYKRRKLETAAQIRSLTSELGFFIPANLLATTTTHAFNNQWNEAQIRRYLGYYRGTFNAAANKGLGGTLGQAQNRIREAERNYGVKMSDAGRNSFLFRIMDGTLTEQAVISYLQNAAASAFPGLAEQIRSGITVREVAEPYFQAMGRLLEINTEDVDLYDPTIRQALTTKDAKGQPTTKTIWQFENDLRKDKRWLKTDNAQDSMMETGHQVLNSFGVTW